MAAARVPPDAIVQRVLPVFYLLQNLALFRSLPWCVWADRFNCLARTCGTDRRALYI